MPKNSAGGASGARPAVAEVRSCVSVRVGRRVRGRAGDRGLDDVLQRRTSALGTWGSHAGRGLRRGAGSVTASTSSTLRPTTAGTLVAGFPRGRFSASPGTRVLSFSRASSTTSPADALRGPGPLGAREGAGDVGPAQRANLAAPHPRHEQQPGYRSASTRPRSIEGNHVGPAQRRYLAAPHPGHEQQSRDHGIGIDTATLGSTTPDSMPRPRQRERWHVARTAARSEALNGLALAAAKAAI